MTIIERPEELYGGQIIAMADAQKMRFGVKILKFRTHFPRTENKTKADKFVKISGQNIYSGSLNRFSRAKVQERMHEYLGHGVSLLKLAVMKEGIKTHDGPWTLTMKFAVNIGYGKVMRNVIKKTGEEKIQDGSNCHEANWDIRNQWIWGKAFEDVCVRAGLLRDDSADVLRETRDKWVPVENFSDRSLTFVFQPHQ